MNKRQSWRFRNRKKTERQTYSEVARELVEFFNRWCSSIKVDSYEKLSDLIVLEQFKYILPERLATFMCEHKVETAAQAAILADEYTCTLVNTHTHTQEQAPTRQK